MTTLQENRALHFETLLAAGREALPGRGHRWLEAQRAYAAQQFLHAGLPSRSDEAWRYTSLEALLDTHWSRHGEQSVVAVDPERRVLVDTPAARLVFVDGRWSPALSQLPMDDAALRAGSLRDALEAQADHVPVLLGSAVLPPDGVGGEPVELPSFAALNTALLEDGAWIQVTAGAHLEHPIELLYLATAAADAGQTEAPALVPRNLIVVEDGAAATVVEHYVGLRDGVYFSNAVTEIHLGADAQVEHARLQDESIAARHLGHVYLRQGRGSRYHGFLVSLGSRWSRTEIHNRMDTAQAECSVDGLYVAGDGQLTDVHLDIDHAVPQCASRERFKGILLGRGRAVFDGRVRVRPDAQQTDAHLANDNLLLSRDAEIDTKPQLEIYADDVKCSHGTTVGQLEPSQLFYLRARGIDGRTARRMLCLGFAMELLDACPIERLRTRVEHSLAARFDAATTT